MSSDKMYVGDVGTAPLVDIKSDLSSATQFNLRVWKTDATTYVIWVSSVYTEVLSAYVADTGVDINSDVFSGLSGGDNVKRRIQYITVSGDLSVAGEYRAQAAITVPNWSGLGGTFWFNVYNEFN